ncbi:MAG: hypothetical protein AAF761_03620, partial [Pseudomonadota bacterium]
MTKYDHRLIDFNDQARGTILDDEYASLGVRIDTPNDKNPAMVFDTAKPTGGDHDLATSNLGKVLIISEDGDSHDPDDNAGGGVVCFYFDDPALVKSLTLLDIEEQGGSVKLWDADGNLIKSVAIPPNGNNKQSELVIDVDGVARMDIVLKGSGAVDNIAFATPIELDGIVEGTDAGERIDLNYTGDPEGDRIDAGDALLPGEAPNDDIVIAGGG